MREKWEYERMSRETSACLDDRIPNAVKFLLRARDIFLARGQHHYAERCERNLWGHWGFRIESMLLRGPVYIRRWSSRYQSKYYTREEAARDERKLKRQRRVELEDRWNLDKTT